MKLQKLSKQGLRSLSDISALERALKTLPEHLQIKEELNHHFADGLYAREMRVPAGSVVVGKMHKYPCINFIMSGEMEVRSTTGRPIRIQSALHFHVTGRDKARRLCLDRPHVGDGPPDARN